MPRLCRFCAGEFRPKLPKVHPVQAPDDGSGMTQRLCWHALVVAGLLFVSPAVADPSFPDRDKPDIDIYALMSGKCPTPKIARRAFPCRAVGYFHSEKGRANFTVAADDQARPVSVRRMRLCDEALQRVVQIVDHRLPPARLRLPEQARARIPR